MENKKSVKKRVLTIILAVLVITASFFSGFFIKYLTMNKEERAIYDLIHKYKKYYLFDDGDLVKDISDAILDDYSKYYTKEEYEEIKREKEGVSKGIGLSLQKADLKILAVLGNSPCEKAGVTVGGKIIAVKVDKKFEMIYNYDDLPGAKSHPSNLYHSGNQQDHMQEPMSQPQSGLVCNYYDRL